MMKKILMSFSIWALLFGFAGTCVMAEDAGTEMTIEGKVDRKGKDWFLMVGESKVDIPKAKEGEKDIDFRRYLKRTVKLTIMGTKTKDDSGKEVVKIVSVKSVEEVKK